MDGSEARRILSEGPRPIDAKNRRVAVQQIVSRLETAYGHSLVTIALYGSTAREADREYSDVELFCVVANNTKTDDGVG
jgi:kanamycin nucleotidyltransferase